MEGPWQAAAPPSPLHAVPNVTVHPSTASVPITVVLHNGPLLCGFNVKGLMLCLESSSYSFLPCTLRILYLFEQNDSAAVGLILKQFSKSSQVFVYLTGMSECRPVHRTMLHNKNSNVRIKQYSNGISLECDEL